MSDIWEFIKGLYSNDHGKTVLFRECIPNPPIGLQFSEIEKIVYAIASDIPAGLTVAIQFPISIEAIVLMLGIWKADSVVMPLNPDLTESELEYCLSQSVDLLIVPQGSFDNVRSRNTDIFEMDESFVLHRMKTHLRVTDPLKVQHCLVLFTSGTTGKPKAVGLSSSNLLASVNNIHETLPLTSDDTTICVMPLFHIHGIVACVLSTFCSGGTLVVPHGGKFSASRFFPTVMEFACTWFTAVPTIHQILLFQDPQIEFPGHLRFIRSSSSKLDPSVLARMEKVFAVPVIEAYAMTETAYQITSNPCDWTKRKPGTVGIPFGSVQVNIVATDGQRDTIGEVCVSGPNVISNYLNVDASDSFIEIEGRIFFRTGDEGSIDADGFLQITGRIKELINRGGEKISPIEIDAILRQDPRVSEAVCFGIPDELYGEAVAVAIVPEEAKAFRTELSETLITQLSRYKVPTRWFFVNSIPKTATGKVQRSLLAKFFLS
jgi:acyl-CoA synthetase (AMP-forming)/AMP-acid ligase II